MALNINEQDIDRFNSIMGSFNSSMLAASKSSKARELAEQHLIKSIMKITGENEKAARSIAKTIREEEEREKKREQREQAMADGVKQAINGLKEFFGGAVSSSQALYNSEDAFTGVIPTLQLLGNAVKAITGALSSFFAGMPIIGGVITAADKAIGVIIDLGTQVMQAQLENASKMVQNFNAVSKSGMTFGASLTHMQYAANDAGMSVGTFTKFVQTNIENLAAMGGSVQSNATAIGRVTKQLMAEDRALLALYGSIDGLAGATSDFAAQQAGYGIDVRRDANMQKAAVAEYLLQQKELTALTGKSAEALKKDEEARRQMAAYQMNLARLGTDQQANIRRNIEMFGAVSKDAADFATEVFNTQGNVTSKQALLFQQQFPELAETIRKTQADAQVLTAESFRTQQSKYIEGRADLLKREAERYNDLFRLAAGGVKGEYIDQLNRTASGTLAAFTKIGNFAKIVADQEADRKRIAEESKKTGKSTMASVIETLEDYKIKMDQRVISRFDDLASITESLIGINNKLYETLIGPASALLIPNLEKLLRKLMNEAGLGVTEVPPGPQTGAVPSTAQAAQDRKSAEDAAKKAAADRDRIVKEQGAASEEAKKARIEAHKAEREAAQARAREESARAKAARESALNPQAPANALPKTSGGTIALPFKSAESTAGGKTNPTMQKVLEGLFTNQTKSFVINAIDDLAHRTPGNPAFNLRSEHLQGLAADIKPTGNMSILDLKDKIIKEMKAQGVAGKVDIHGVGANQHIHMEVSPRTTDEQHGAANIELMNEQNGLLKEQNELLRQLNRTVAVA